MPVFPSVEWFDAVRGFFNSDNSNRTAGGGMAEADVGVKFGDQVFLLKFAGFECERASEIQESDLDNTDFFLDMHPDDWLEMVANIRENGEADLEHTLNTLDMSSEYGLARSATDDQYRLDMFFRYNQTLQFFFDASSNVETEFDRAMSATEPGG